MAMAAAKDVEVPFRAGPMDGGAALYKRNQPIEKVMYVTPETADPDIIPVCHAHKYVYDGKVYVYAGSQKHIPG